MNLIENVAQKWKSATEQDIEYTAHLAFGEIVLIDKRERDVFQSYPMIASGDVRLRRVVPIGGWDLESVGCSMSGGSKELMELVMRKAKNEFRRY